MKSEKARSLEGLDGFFCALIAGPDVVLPSEYLPVIWEVAHREGAPDAAHELPEKIEEIRRGIPEQLKLISARIAVVELEGLQAHPIAEEVQAEMKPVHATRDVGELDWIEGEMLEVHTARAGHLLVVAATTEPPIAVLEGADIDSLVSWCREREKRIDAEARAEYVTDLLGASQRAL